MLWSLTILWFQVRQAAFQSLGPFISTFANPSRAGLYIQEDGTPNIRPPSQDVEAGSASGSAKLGSCGSTSSTRYAVAGSLPGPTFHLEV